MLPNISPSLWQHIYNIWKAIMPGFNDAVIPYDLALALARFTRNLVAGVPNNQNKA